MTFQFPNNPSVGDTVTNASTGTTYEWVSPPGVWKIKSADTPNVSVYEGPEPPPVPSEYLLWFDTNSLTLKYFYCSGENECNWVSSAFTDESIESLMSVVSELSNVIIELQTKVNVLENTSFILME